MRTMPMLDIWSPDPEAIEDESPADKGQEVDSVTEFYRSTARSIWPNGTMYYCPVCQRQISASVNKIAKYMADGIPACCGERMRIGDRQPTSTGA